MPTRLSNTRKQYVTTESHIIGDGDGDVNLASATARRENTQLSIY